MHTRTSSRKPTSEMKPGMKAQSMRLSNTSLVLKTVLSAQKPISRTNVSDITGLTRATVSRLVDSLIDAGLLDEMEPSRNSPGRPSFPLRATKRQCLAIGLEINTDYLAACLMDLSGAVLEKKTIEGNYRNSDPEKVMKSVSDAVDQLAIPHGAFVAGVTLCVPGIFTGTEVRIAPNLGWNNVDLAPLFVTKHELPPLKLLNEADGGGYSVLYSRPGRMNDETTFAYISGHVGIGASMFFSGEALTGRHNWAGEFGHMCVDPSGPRCACTSNGCLEQYAGQDAIMRAAGLPLDASLSELIAAFDDGDEAARVAIDSASTSLGRGIATIVNLLDVDSIVFGGILSTLLSRMSELLNAELEYRVLGSRWSSITLSANERGPLSASLGACYVAFEKLIADPAVLID